MPALVVGATYPLLDAFWTTLWIVGFFVWIWLLIVVFADIFASRDLSGWGKAAWTIGVIVLPLLGVLLYLIVRGGSMHERKLEAAQAQEAAFRQYVQDTVASGNGSKGAAEELAKLADLRDRGVISEEEFDREKAKVLT